MYQAKHTAMGRRFRTKTNMSRNNKMAFKRIRFDFINLNIQCSGFVYSFQYSMFSRCFICFHVLSVFGVYWSWTVPNKRNSATTNVVRDKSIYGTSRLASSTCTLELLEGESILLSEQHWPIQRYVWTKDDL